MKTSYPNVINYVLQLGQLYSAYTLKTDLPFAFLKLTKPSKAAKESFSDLKKI